jgi:sec-independent protein translocase protein TatC
VPRETMGFFEHLDELRVRFMRALAVFFVGFLACYALSDFFMGVLREPLFAVMPPDKQQLYFTSLFENFLTHLKIAGYASVFFFSPYFFYEVWGFIAPGLYPHERKLVMPFVLAATTFFLGGAAFAYYVLFPVGFKYFISYGGPTDVAMLTIDAYYSTVLKLLLLFGVSFEMPVLIVLLGFLGVIDADGLRRQRKPAILGITVLSAMFAPPDAVSMLLLMAPLILMYEGSIYVVQWLGLRRQAAQAVEPGSPESDPLRGASR